MTCILSLKDLNNFFCYVYQLMIQTLDVFFHVKAEEYSRQKDDITLLTQTANENTNILELTSLWKKTFHFRIYEDYKGKSVLQIVDIYKCLNSHLGPSLVRNLV